MTWALLHDRDNWLRNGMATITSTPTPVVGFPSAALRDGVQAAYFRAASITNKTISIAPTQARTLRYFAAHDLRLHGAVALTGAKLEARVVQTWHTLREWTRAEIEAADWSFGWVGELENVFEVQFSIAPETSYEWSLAEIVLGADVVIGGADGAPPPARHTVHSRTWNTVENGPWRTKLAEPVSSFTLTFPAGREELLRDVYRRSEGGFRPVSFMPDTNGVAAYHGHLSDEHSLSLGLGGVYEESQLVFNESQRSVR